MEPHVTDSTNSSLDFSMGDSPIAIRQDLQVETIRRGLDVTHIIKDPVNLKYFEFDEHEMALIRQLNGHRNWDEICQWFNRRFPPLRLTHQALQDFLWRLYQQGLLLATAKGQGRRISERTEELHRREWTQILSQPWVIRLPGITPGRWLGVADFLMGWLFSPWFVALAMSGLLVLLAFVIAEHTAIIKMSLESASFLSQENLVLFAGVIIVTKMLHEMGHAVAAFRRGCECHEMGILLLAGLPSLYCDVSDTWMLPERWKRITVSLAGIWIETLVAALAFIIWANSVPGLVHAISFNVMVVCSLGTILFNANPLVRYDGYYVLMDVTGVSNLGQRSQEAVSRFFMRWVLGSPETRPIDAPEIPGWCPIYGLAAAVYRVMLTCAILWGLHLALKPYSLSGLVWGFAFVAFSMWGIRMSQTATRQVHRAVAAGAPRWRMTAGLILLAGLIWYAAAIPLPRYVFGEAVLEPVDQKTLVVTIAGQLRDRQDSGTSVESGQVVASLENEDVEREIRLMEAEVSVHREKRDSLLARRNQDARASEQIPAADAGLAALEHRLQHLIEERTRLQLRARERGTVYPAPVRLANPEHDDLPTWTGSLLDPVNRNAWTDVGDAFCQTGSLNDFEAVAYLAQDDLDAVTLGQPADIFSKSSGQLTAGIVSKISNIEANVRDDAAIGLKLPPTSDASKTREVRGKWYRVQVRCSTPVPKGTFVRSRGKIRIHVGTRSFGEWFVQQFFKTFRWHA